MSAWNQIKDLLNSANDYITIHENEDGGAFRQVRQNKEVKFELYDPEDKPAIFDSGLAKWASGGRKWITVSTQKLVGKVLDVMRTIPRPQLRKRYIREVRSMQKCLPRLHQTLTQEHTAGNFHHSFVTACIIAHIIFDRPLPLRSGYEKVGEFTSPRGRKRPLSPQ